jgi:hypothetical protein
MIKKEELLKIQRDKPPFGGFVASDLKDVGQIYASPGPIFEPALPGGGWPVGVVLITCVELFGDAFEPGSKQGWLSIVCARAHRKILSASAAASSSASMKTSAGSWILSRASLP